MIDAALGSLTRENCCTSLRRGG